MKLKVTFHMVTPIFLNAAKAREPIMLDSILGFFWMQEHGHHKNSSELREENLIFPELPMKRTNKCYHDSAMIFAPETCYVQDRCTKRALTAIYFRGLMNSFNEGTSKSMLGAFIDYNATVTLTLTCYVDVTDESEFKRLTNKILSYGIGAKTSMGFGRVGKIDYEPYPDAETPELQMNGRPTRALPMEDFHGIIDAKRTALGYTNYYAPYWYVPHKHLCFLPAVDILHPETKALTDQDVNEMLQHFHEKMCPEDASFEDDDDFDAE